MSIPKQVVFKQNVFIYTLSDPFTEEVRYVGKTIKTLNRRLSGHIAAAKRKASSYSSCWIKSLLDRGKLPEISLLEMTSNSDWQETERFWISYLRFLGFRLTNITLGGEGFHGKPLTKEHKAKISLSMKGMQSNTLGKKMPNSHRESCSRRAKEQMKDKEFLKRLCSLSRKARIGSKASSKTIERMSKARKGKPWTKARRDAQNKRQNTHVCALQN